MHDAITKLPGSLNRTMPGIRFPKAQGLKVTIANVLMAGNFSDQPGVIALARELGVAYTSTPPLLRRWTEIHPQSPCAFRGLS